jgi:hypothetical protein
MLWDAGQERLARERVERYAVSRDAALSALPGSAFKNGQPYIPAYARAERAAVTAVSGVKADPAVRDAMLSRLGLMFPGAVKGKVN